VADAQRSTERESHPVGTTVKLAHFLDYIPVRKQTATKNSAKCLAKIRRLMQAYALARPAVRFRLHVLKAKNNNGDFMYAPKASSNVEDAVFKAIGKDCALQCGWTALESDGFEIQAFLPKPMANGSKIANQGAFISIDSRPVSNSRGTMRKIVAAFKERLRKSNHSLATVKDPFFSMNIICPPDSYDPNIEPAKDDVLFDNSDVVMGAVDKLLRSYYPAVVIEAEMEPPTSAQQSYEHEYEGVQPALYLSHSERVIPHTSMDEKPTPKPQSAQPRWRASMYGIDEEDLEYLQVNQPPVIEEEEEGRHAAEVSNPWTIARMNTTIKPTNTSSNGQLMSPVRSHSDRRIPPSSPTVQTTPHKVSHVPSLTLQTTSRMSIRTLSPEREREQNIRHLPHPSVEEERTHSILSGSQTTTNDRLSANLTLPEQDASEQILSHSRRPIQIRRFYNGTQVSSSPSRGRREPRISTNDPLIDANEGPDDTWFGQPMRGSQNSQPHCRPKRRPNQNTPLFPSDTSSRALFPTADPWIDNDLSSGRNTDIRSFLTRTGGRGAVEGAGVEKRPPLTPINRPSQIGSTPADMTGARGRPSSQPSPSRAMSHEPLLRSQNNKNVSPRCSNNQANRQSLNTTEQLTIYEDSFSSLSRPRPSSAGSQRPSLVLTSPNKPSQNSCDMAAYFKQYQDRETASVDRFSSPTRRLKPRFPPPHELRTSWRPQRRRTTDGAQRTKSSNLPLERVPHGYHIQDAILSTQVSIASMIQTSRKLDMRRNSLEWGYTADEERYDAFAEPVTAKSVMAWVLQLHVMLRGRYGELPGADARSMLHEAIQRGLDERKGDAEEMVGVMMDEIGSTVNDVDTGTEHSRAIKVEDEVSDFDEKKFVDFDVQMIEDDDVDLSVFDEVGIRKVDGKKIRKVDEEKIKKVDEEFGDDIDDDMLLDM
jgi:hypothetical protein